MVTYGLLANGATACWIIKDNMLSGMKVKRRPRAIVLGNDPPGCVSGPLADILHRFENLLHFIPS